MFTYIKTSFCALILIIAANSFASSNKDPNLFKSINDFLARSEKNKSAGLSTGQNNSSTQSLFGTSAAVVTAAIGVVGLGLTIRNTIVTSEQTARNEYDAARSLAAMKARDALLYCMITNKREEKDQLGVPLICNELYKIFEVTVDMNEQHEIMRDYRKFVHRTC